MRIRFKGNNKYTWPPIHTHSLYQIYLKLNMTFLHSAKKTLHTNTFNSVKYGFSSYNKDLVFGPRFQMSHNNNNNKIIHQFLL